MEYAFSFYFPTIGEYVTNETVVLILITFASVCTTLCGCNHLRAEEIRTADHDEELPEISFRFHQGGIASSQYAIWIENETNIPG